MVRVADRESGSQRSCGRSYIYEVISIVFEEEAETEECMKITFY